MNNDSKIEKPVVPEETMADLSARFDELETLVKKNIQWNEVVYNEVKRTRRRLTWMAIGGYVRLLFWLLPVILGLIFLPPLFRRAQEMYESITRPAREANDKISHVLDSVKGWQGSVTSSLSKFQ